MSKLVTARKGYPRNKHFALNVDRIHNNIFDGLTGSTMNYSIRPLENFLPERLSDNTYKKLAIGSAGQMHKAFHNYGESVLGNMGKGPLVNNTSMLNTDANTFFNNGSNNLGTGKKGAGWAGAGKVALGAGLEMAGSIGRSDSNKRGMWDVLDPVHHLAGGRESGAGNAMGDAGVALTKAGLQNGQPWLALAGAGLKVVGGLTNAAFGVKENKELKQAVESSIAQNQNFVSNASSFDDIETPITAVNTNVYDGGWFSGARARRKNQALQDRMIAARDWADRSVGNNINNLVGNLINDALASYAAYGGPIDVVDPSTPIGYSIYTDKYIKNNNNNNNITNMFAGMPNSMFAFGGNTLTHGSTFSSGLTHIDKGGSHEENFEQGVLMGVDNQGTPNLVEEGEVIYDDYVFSNRLTVPKHKYAKGGKLKKGEELPYELKILKPYEGLTFADAAKKIEKKSGIVDRPNDPIAIRGFEAGLGVLYTSQEREREKEKLQEMQEAIDNMSPEELQALQQLMAMALQLSKLQAMAELQQLMMPEGMEYMQQPTEQYQPIAALGGLLNTSDKKLFYDGGWTDYLKELKKYGITPEQYIEYLNRVNTSDTLITPDTIGDDNFGKDDIADEVLNKINTITKQYNRRAKKQGIKIDDLKGTTKAQYNRELNQAILRGLLNADYDVSQDTELTFNSSNVSEARNKQQAYNNMATYNDLIARGGRAVELDDLGRPTWEAVTGLSKIDNSAEGFYDNLGDLNEDALTSKGIYNYISAKKSSIGDFGNIGLRGWNKNEDGSYSMTEEYVNPDKYSQVSGNSSSTYKPSILGDLTYGAEGYKDALDKIQNNEDYTAQTAYVKNAIEAAKGDYNKLPTEILNYLRYLDENTGNRETKLLTRDDAGNVNGIANNATELYDRRRNDNIYGIYHYQFDRGNDATANRYYYKDPKSGLKVYISKPEESFTISETFTPDQRDGITFNDYEVTGINKNRTLTLLPTGEVVDITDINDIDNWTKLNKPVLVDNTDNLGYGVTGITDWADYSNSPAAKATVETDNDPFPKAAKWPYLAGAGLQGLALLYNALSPKDYSNADAMIKAALNAGTYNPIEFRPIGNYLTYKPDDPWFYTSPIMAQSNATLRALANKVSPSAGAETIANNYNTMLALGQAQRQLLDNNFNKYAKVGEYNKDTDKFNSEGFLKADMANLDAANRARYYTLEGLKNGYMMRLAIDDAKANAINMGVNGLANLAFTYGQQKDLNNLLKWRANQAVDGNGIYFEDDKRHPSAKGGKIKRRKKGLSF